jgi:hypothetical protein
VLGLSIPIAVAVFFLVFDWYGAHAGRQCGMTPIAAMFPAMIGAMLILLLSILVTTSHWLMAKREASAKK